MYVHLDHAHRPTNVRGKSISVILKRLVSLKTKLKWGFNIELKSAYQKKCTVEDQKSAPENTLKINKCIKTLDNTVSMSMNN